MTSDNLISMRIILEIKLILEINKIILLTSKNQISGTINRKNSKIKETIGGKANLMIIKIKLKIIKGSIQIEIQDDLINLLNILFYSLLYF